MNRIILQPELMHYEGLIRASLRQVDQAEILIMPFGTDGAESCDISEDNCLLLVLKAVKSEAFWQELASIRKVHPNIPVLMVGSEKDFDLAYQALQLQIPYYLMAPIKAADWLRIIKACISNAEASRRMRQDLSKLKDYEVSAHQSLMEKLMLQLVDRPEEMALMLNEVSKRYKVRFVRGYFFIVEIALLDMKYLRLREEINHAIEERLKSRLGKAYEVMVSPHLNTGLGVIVNMSCDYITDELMTVLREEKSSIDHLLETYGLAPGVMGIGPVVDDIRDILQSGIGAVRALHQWNINPDKGFHATSHIDAEYPGQALISGKVQKTVYQYLRQLRFNDLWALVDGLLMEEKYQTEPFNVQLLTEELMDVAYYVWEKHLNTNYMNRLKDKVIFSTLYDVDIKMEKFSLYLEGIGDSIRDQLIGPVNRQIQQAILYMKDHFGQQVTMDEVALSVDLSPNYFSNLFRESIGMTFLAYLTDLRLQKGRSLLEETDMTVIAISQSVGYNDPKYFTRLFKSEFKLTPGRYRKDFRLGQLASPESMQ